MASNDYDIVNLALIRLGANTITSLTDGSRNANAANVIYEMIRDEVLRSFDWGFAKRRAWLDEKTPNKVVITGVTQANPGVVSYTHVGVNDPVDGNKVEIADIVGMTGLNSNQYVVDNVDAIAETFELMDKDTTSLAAYVSGGTAERVVPASSEWAYCYDKPSDCLAVRMINDDPDITFEMTDDGIYCDESDIVITYTKQVTTVSVFDVTFVSAFAARLMGELSIAITGSSKKMELGFGLASNFITKAKTGDAKETKESPFDRNSYVDARR